jgi:arginase family enzyme
MPLAMITGRGEQTIVEGAGATVVADTDAFLVGSRDLDPGEQVLLDESDVGVVGIGDVAAAVPPGRDLYVHIDTDVVDPEDVPAINYPAPDGPSAVAVAESVAALAATGRVVAFSVSTWNPVLPGAVRTPGRCRG